MYQGCRERPEKNKKSDLKIKTTSQEVMETKSFNFIELYLESADENIEVVKKQLEDAGIDYEQSLETTERLIKQQRAKLKLKKGKKLREKLLVLIENVLAGKTEVHNMEQFQFAFRNLDGVNEEDLEELQQDEKLLIEINKYLQDGL
jgi:hypothetical protein